jgi:hypothetical protein
VRKAIEFVTQGLTIANRANDRGRQFRDRTDREAAVEAKPGTPDSNRGLNRQAAPELQREAGIHEVARD